MYSFVNPITGEKTEFDDFIIKKAYDDFSELTYN